MIGGAVPISERAAHRRPVADSRGVQFDAAGAVNRAQFNRRREPARGTPR